MDLHVLCKTQFSFLTDDFGVSWVQFYDIPEATIKNCSKIYIYFNATKPPILSGEILGSYKAGSTHKKQEKNEDRVGIVFHAYKPYDVGKLDHVHWPTKAEKESEEAPKYRPYSRSWATD